MNWLPRDTPLGELKLEETFVFYDGPRLFSCRSLTDQLYLVAWADDSDEADRWLYMPISDARLKIIKSGGMSVRSGYLNAEGIVYIVTIPYDVSVEDSLQMVAPKGIPADILPGEHWLDLDTQTAEPAIPPTELERRAKQEHRTRVRLEFDRPVTYRSEAPTREVGQILIRTQMLLDAVGAAIGEEQGVAQVGRISKDKLQKTSSDVLAFAAASFVIEIGASSFDDLFGESVFADSVLQIIDLLDPQLKSPDIQSRLSVVGIRAAKSFRKFVVELADSGGNVAVSAAGTNIRYVERQLPSSRLETLVSILSHLVPDEEVVEIRERMELFAYDAKKKRFGLKDSDGLDYEGRVDERVVAGNPNPTINRRYLVVVEASSVLDEAIGETKTSYVLVQLIAVDADDDGRSAASGVTRREVPPGRA
ncbi:hypothetical protein H7J86_11530 [Mycobacterium hackensackense]|uniref:DUF6575 domain-containing protein n=1 Tax=Mycobacterium hackensackense TaxID=228909 RepID=UPI0022658BFD|nr:DUF6575 domain-containing protein [Mycobacterium hackensackense]MCV7252796.1 hypothetical protein [Mycobacterium hackensackense]